MSVCNGCALKAYRADRLTINPKDEEHPVVLFVGGFPEEVDVISKVSFWSREGRMFDKLVNNIRSREKPTEQITPVYAYTCRCREPGNKKFKPSAETVERCSSYLREWIDTNKPAAIVALGNDALRGLGIQGTTTMHRGSIQNFKTRDGTVIKVVCSYHMLQVFKSPGYYPVLRKDVLKAVRIAQGKHLDSSATIEILVNPDEIVARLESIQKEVGERVKTMTSKFPGKISKAVVAFDTETSSLRPYVKEDRVISVSLSWEQNKGLAFPFQHKDCVYSDEDFQRIKQALENVLTDRNMRFVMANGKFDLQWLTHYGIKNQGQEWDIVVAEHCLEEDKKGEYSLKDITRDRLPAFGDYEDELKTLLDAAWKGKDEKLAELKKKFTDERKDMLLKLWLDMDIKQRIAKLSEWNVKGFLKLSDTAGIAEVRMVKRKGEMVIPKKYSQPVTKLLSSLPTEELDAMGLPQFVPPEELTIKNYEDIDLQKLLWYGAMDAITTRLIMLLQKEEFYEDDDLCAYLMRKKNVVRKNPGMVNLGYGYRTISIPLSHHLAHMEYHGIRIDRERAREYQRTISDSIAEIEESMRMEVGHAFNPNSGPDLIKLLYKEYAFEVFRKTESGEPSVDAQALKELSDAHPDMKLLNDLLLYRRLVKTNSTYIGNWIDMSAYDGKIHCNFSQTGTATFRLSSSNPNLQNVPFSLKLSGDKMLNLKALFLPDEGFDIYDLDIKNAEMRTLCGYSMDTNLINAFNNGKDLHSLTACGIDPELTYEGLMKNKEDKSTQEYRIRQVAKKVNFGTIYCMSGETLQKRLWEDMRIRVTVKEAEEYLEGFFKAYPAVRTYISDCEQMSDLVCFVHTFFGRRRRFPTRAGGINRIHRQAVNARIQSTSSDLVMRCLIDLDSWLQNRGDGSCILLTVHDSLPFQMPHGCYDGLKKELDRIIIQHTKEVAPWLPVEWAYDCGWGPNYGETHGAIS